MSEVSAFLFFPFVCSTLDRKTLAQLRATVLRMNAYVQQSCQGEKDVEDVRRNFRKLCDVVENDYG